MPEAMPGRCRWESGRRYCAPVMADPPLIDSLRRAVAAAPDDVPLLVHLSGVLLDAGHADEAIGHLASAIRLDPGSSQARELMARALAPPPPVPPPAPSDPGSPPATP